MRDEAAGSRKVAHDPSENDPSGATHASLETPGAPPLARRAFLQRGAWFAAAGAGGLAGCVQSGQAPGAQTRPQIRWRLASSFPRALDTIFGAAEVLSARVAELTDGAFTIRVHAPGEVVPALEVLEAVKKETVQIGHSASYYYTGWNKALAFDTAVPFGLGARAQMAWMTSAGGRELVNEMLADFGVRALPGGNTGVQMGGWFRRPIGSLADLQGLKMRIPGLGGEVMARMGVNVQVLPGGEIYPALERGAIDATEWVGPYDDQKLGFHKVARHYYYPGWWEPGPALSFYVSEAAWAQLPPSYQAALHAAAAEAAKRMLNDYDAKNPPALAQLIAEGVQLHPFPPDVMQAAARVMDEYHAEQNAADPAYRKIHTHWDAFRVASNRWLATAERSYGEFTYR